uniref:UCR_hinge domain-containing protein n=1 Tax=Angiostrongylus cantonensis TaxID=6313 RepID=A0A0K0DEK6_ANGCA
MPSKKEPQTKKEPAEGGGDQLQQWRKLCASEAADLKKILDECNERVNSRKQTEETCTQNNRREKEIDLPYWVKKLPDSFIV